MFGQSLRVGFIGAGFQACNLATATERSEGLEVAGFFARTRKSAAEAARTFGAKAWHDESAVHRAGLDIVVIASTSAAHAANLRAFADAAPLVFVEKPVVISEADIGLAEELVTSGRLVVGHVLRTAPGVTRMFQQLSRGVIGEPLDLISSRAQLLSTSAGWKGDPALTGGFLLHEIHELDLLCLAGGAVSAAHSNVLRDGQGRTVGAHTGIRFAGGAVGTHRLNSRAHAQEWYVEINGEAGSMRVDFLRATVSLLRRGLPVQEWPVLGTKAANGSLKTAVKERSHNASGRRPAPWMAELAKGEIEALARVARGDGSLLLEAPLRATAVALSLQHDPESVGS